MSDEYSVTKTLDIKVQPQGTPPQAWLHWLQMLMFIAQLLLVPGQDQFADMETRAHKG